MSNLIVLDLVLDDDSAVPPYEQVRATLAARIAEGTLAAGTRLPPVRTLAGQLDLAPGTVARAYRELEVAGLVNTGGRAGTVVSDGGDRAVSDVRAAAERYVGTARALGLADDVTLGLVRAQLGAR